MSLNRFSFDSRRPSHPLFFRSRFFHGGPPGSLLHGSCHSKIKSSINTWRGTGDPVSALFLFCFTVLLCGGGRLKLSYLRFQLVSVVRFVRPREREAVLIIIVLDRCSFNACPWCHCFHLFHIAGGENSRILSLSLSKAAFGLDHPYRFLNQTLSCGGFALSSDPHDLLRGAPVLTFVIHSNSLEVLEVLFDGDWLLRVDSLIRPFF